MHGRPTRRASSASNSIGTSASRHHAWPLPTHGAGSVAAPVKRSSTSAVAGHLHPTDLHAGADERRRRCPARHVDAHRPFARIDRSEATFRLGHLVSRRRYSMAGHRRSQTTTTTYSDEGQEARGEQCSVLHSDRGRGTGGIARDDPAGATVTHRRHHGGRGGDRRRGRRGAVAATADAGADVVGVVDGSDAGGAVVGVATAGTSGLPGASGMTVDSSGVVDSGGGVSSTTSSISRSQPGRIRFGSSNVRPPPMSRPRLRSQISGQSVGSPSWSSAMSHNVSPGCTS